MDDDEPELHKNDIFRDGKVHVLADKCATCIFRPHERPVEGARVADLVRQTKDVPGATVPCHHTLYGETEHQAICRGWYDRFGKQDAILELAEKMDIIEYDPVPPDTGTWGQHKEEAS